MLNAAPTLLAIINVETLLHALGVPTVGYTSRSYLILAILALVLSYPLHVLMCFANGLDPDGARAIETTDGGWGA